MTEKHDEYDRGHSSYIPLAYLTIAAFAIIGGIEVLEWVLGHIPPSIGAALTAVGNWMSAPMLSPFDLIGLVLVGVIVIVVLMYPMVGPRP